MRGWDHVAEYLPHPMHHVATITMTITSRIHVCGLGRRRSETPLKSRFTPVSLSD